MSFSTSSRARRSAVARFLTANTLDALERRLQFCASHAFFDQASVELRPDLVERSLVAGVTKLRGVVSGSDHLDTPTAGGKRGTSTLAARGGSAGGDVLDPADIVWVNRGSPTSDTDSFNARFGAAAEAARAVVDAVIVAYERMIVSFDYSTANQKFNLTLNMGAANGGFGASAGLNSQLGGKPKSGTITMGAGSGSTGTGNGWFLDPTPFESSEFQGAIVNGFAGDAQSGSPAAGKGDFFTVVAAELTHCIGLFGNSVAGWAARTSNTGIVDTAEGGGIGTFWVFNGPSIQHLLTSNNGGSGGQNFNAAIHGAGPITTSVGGVTYNGAQDQGNAVYEFGRRYLVNNTFALMFKDAYAYQSIDPSKFGTMYSNLNTTTGQVLIRGGASTSSDNITITRTGSTLRVAVDVGADVAGTGALPGPGNLPAFVTEYDISQVTSLNIQPGAGDDTVTLGADLGINVSITGSTGIDTVVLQGAASNDAIVYSGTTASIGTTTVSLLSGVEAVSIDGGDGIDTLTLVGTAAADTFNVNANTFSGTVSGTFANLEAIRVNTLDGADTVNVNAPTASVSVDVGSTGDVVNLVETLPGNSVSLLGTGVALTNVSVNSDAIGSASFDVASVLTLNNLTVASGGSVTGAGDLTVTNVLTFNGGAIAGTGLLTVNGSVTASGVDAKTLGRRLAANGGINLSDGTLTVVSGLSSTLPALVASALNITGGTLDLTDNAAVIDYTGASPIASIAAALATGYASGAWTGSGIASSTAAATTGRSIGYGEATDLFGAFPATFSGAAIDDTSIVLKYALAADADFSGAVDFADLVRLAQNYNQSGQTFARGDFDFDGTVGFSDLVILAQQYGQTLLGTSGAITVATTPAAAAGRKSRRVTAGGIGLLV